MKLTRFLPIALLFVGVSLSAQNFAKKNLEQLKSNQWLTELKADFSHPEFFETYAPQLGLNENSEMRLIRAHDMPNGWSHFRYQQFYKELPVLTGHYLLHEQNGNLKKANGALLPNINVPVTPSVSAKAAVESAKVKAIRDIAAENEGLVPEGLTADGIRVINRRLAIADKRYPEWSGTYTLVHVFELDFNAMPPKHDEYFVDALSGNIIAIIPKICSGSVTGIVKTKYYGEQEVITDSIAPNQFLLRDETRGDGIVTENDVTRAPFEDEDNYWDNSNVEIDEVAGDAHYCATAFYDLLMEKFDWNGLDNAGHELRSRIHIGNGRSVVNAFWNGSFASFGDGNCDEYAPLTTLTVVGHEFAHGLTEFTSGLIYSAESGGLNEAMSDIFGKALAYYENPDDFNWKIGYDFLKSPDANSFRDMSNPNDFGDPKFYLGENWSRFPFAVHTNSGVFNYWFYLLVEGEQGTNQAGVDYDVKPLGMDKAIQIVFGTETGYLTPASTYQECMLGTLQVVEDLYGAGSAEMASVREAWKAVGVDYKEPFTLPLDFEITVLEGDSLYCDRDQPIDVTVQLKNLSAGNIAAGTDVELGYFFTSLGWFTRRDQQTETFTLPQMMAPGDSVQFTFANQLDVSNSNTNDPEIVGFITEMVQDQYAFNDTSGLIINVAENPGIDVEFEISSVRVNACDTDEARVTLRFENTGCEWLPEGTALNSTLNYEGETFQFETILDDPLAPGDTEFDFFNFDINLVLPGSREVTGSLDFADDTNPDNNNHIENLRMFVDAQPGYEQNFRNFILDDDIYLNVTSQFRARNALVTYQGNEMMAFTSNSFSPPASFAESCPTLQKTFTDNSSYVSQINLCVDASGVNDPLLSFDMIKFAFANNLALDPMHTAFVQVDLLTANDFDPIFIYDQQSGLSERHNINLPSNYSGTVRLSIFTVSGEEDILTNGQFDQADVILIDNIQFTDGFTDVSEISENQTFTVSPNPSSGIFQFENIEALPGEFDIQIFDPFGKKVGQLNDITYRTSWSAETVAAGVYYYKVMQQNELVDYGKLVVQK